MFRRFLLTAMAAVAVALGAPAVSQAQYVIDLNASAGSDSVSFVITNNGISTSVSYTTTGTVSLEGVTLGSSGTLTNLVVAGPGIITAVPFGGIFAANSQTGVTITGLALDGYTFTSSTDTSNNPGTGNDIPAAFIRVSNATIINGGSSDSFSFSATENEFTKPAMSGYTGTGFNVQGVTGSVMPSNPTGVATSTYNGVLESSTTIQSNSDTGFSSGIPANTPFTLGVGFTVTGLPIGDTAGNVSASTDLFKTGTGPHPNISVTPAPAGLILAATMVPFFGLLRKRLRKMASETTLVA